MIPWLTLETLAADIVSVASVGDTAREFANWYRVLQRLLAKTPACYDNLTTKDLAEKVRETRQSGRGIDITVPTNSGRYRLLTRPVFGPVGDVHAVRLWLGPATTRLPSPRPAVGAVWDLDTQTLLQPDTVTELAGSGSETYVPTLSTAELFQRIPMFDRHAELLDLLYDPDGGGKMQFDAAVCDRQGRHGMWRITLRTRVDERGRGAWWLIEDVTSASCTPARLPLESAGLREAHRRAGTHLALLQLQRPSIAHWLTDPAPWVRWDYLYRPADVFHPDDRSQLTELGEHLRAADTAGMTIRTLNYLGEYTATRLLLYPHPGYLRRHLALAQLVWVAAESGADGSMSQLDQVADSRTLGYDVPVRDILARDHAS